MSPRRPAPRHGRGSGPLEGAKSRETRPRAPAALVRRDRRALGEQVGEGTCIQGFVAQLASLAGCAVLALLGYALRVRLLGGNVQGLLRED